MLASAAMLLYIRPSVAVDRCQHREPAGVIFLAPLAVAIYRCVRNDLDAQLPLARAQNQHAWCSSRGGVPHYQIECTLLPTKQPAPPQYAPGVSPGRYVVLCTSMYDSSDIVTATGREESDAVETVARWIIDVSY